MDALAALMLQIAWGADEALADDPVDRLDARAPDAAAAAFDPPSPGRAAPPPAPPLRPAPAPLIPAAGAVTRAQAAAAASDTVEALRAALAAFEDCPLRDTASNLVFSDGNPQAGLMLIGEAPGAEEDRAGKPFIGASGRLLDRMLASVGLDRTQLLITNLIPWRPPGNRPPTDTEIMTCLPFLLRHVALLRPRRLVLLGGMSTKALTGATQGIRRTRGRWMEVAIPGLERPLPALPMLHPAYLLRTPGAKRDAWADLLLLRRTLDEDAAAISGTERA